MHSTRSLRQELESWDEKDTDAIRAVYEHQHGKRGFLGSLIRLSSENYLEIAASWLVKHHLEQHDPAHALTASQAKSWFAAANQFEHWQARLHALQTMALFEVPSGSVRDAKRLIERGLADENKFVRAWAYNGFVVLATTHPRFRVEAEQLLEDAEHTETAASVRARIRQIRKKQLW